MQHRFFLGPLRIRSGSNRLFLWLIAILASASLACITARAQGPTPGQNINMVSGTKWPDGDPFLQRQNEPSIAVSTRNPRHLLAGANDYRTVDLNFFATDETGDAWLGLFKSFDGGASWQSTLLPGYPLDQTPEGKSSPLKGFSAASDPVVRPGTNGLFFYSGIAFNRGTNLGAVFVARFIDLNNKENGSAATGAVATNTDPVRYIGTTVLDNGTAGQFADKPWVIADVPRGNAANCTVTVAEPGAPGGAITQSFLAGNVYVAWTRFVGGSNLIRSQIYISRSLDCGATWSAPDKISETYPINQGVTMAIDPNKGTLYVGWRTLAGASSPDSINVAISSDYGQTFTKGIQVTALPPFNSTNPGAAAFFDLQSSTTQMRSLAFPSIAVDNNGEVYVAWAQRGVGPNGDARIMLATSTTNGVSWSAPMPVDNNVVTDDSLASFPRGHQFMPQLTFSGGKLLALYYDLRLDHTLGFFTPNSNCPAGEFFCPSPQTGKFYAESRNLEGELVGNSQNPAVFTPFVDDAKLTQRRHTIEVFVAQAIPTQGFAPSFSPGTRVSNYRFGERDDANDVSGELQQLQVDPPNFPLFKGGTTPFFGDYIDIAGLSMLQQATGSWTFNAGSEIAPVFHATWTDNRDVRPPADGNWQHYTPVGGGGLSIFSPGSSTPFCVTGDEGMRNQNIYTSLITQGLVVSSPQNSKPLGPSLQRALVVLVQNETNLNKTFRLTIGGQPPGGFASFTPGTNNPGPPPLPPTPPVPVTATLDVLIAAHSGAARTVFAVSSAPTTSITVNVDEITSVGGTIVTGGLSSFVVLNPDATNPSLINADGAPANTDIASLEIYNPNFSNPNFSNPNFSNPNFSNSQLSNPNFSNPNFSNPNFSNPEIAGSTVQNPNYSNGDLSNPNFSNPNFSNPNFSNPNFSNTSYADASYTATNTGNTSASYNVNLVLDGNLPNNAQFQLLVNKTYLTPVAQACQLQQQQATNVVSVNDNPNFSNPNFSNPNFSNPNFSNNTLALAPGESAVITLRGSNVTCLTGARCRGAIPGVANMEDIVTQVAPVVTAQAANTNDPTNTPPTVTPLFITTATLPDGINGQNYSGDGVSLQAIGGKPPYTWSISSGNLPAGLTLNGATGLISGAPDATAGTYPFTVQATDSATPTPNTASRQFNIRIANPLVITTASPLPIGTQGMSYGPFTFTVNGGIPPYSWTPVANIDGLNFNSSGVLSGIPTATGTFSFTAAVADSSSPMQSASSTMTLNVVVPVPPVAFLTFVTQPTNTAPGVAISPPVQVQATDSTGAAVPAIPITLTINSNPGGGTLSGTLTGTTDATGITTFSNLSIDKAGIGYILLASSGAASAISNPFSVTPVAAFSSTGSMAVARWGATATTLGNGKVLVTGGVGPSGSSLASAELYDPTTGVFTSTASAMSIARSFHTATLLMNGQVLISGGGTNSAEIYDPSSGTFTNTIGPNAIGLMSESRSSHTATLLTDGRVLIAGGTGDSTAEIFSPLSGMFTPASNSMGAARSFHTATLLGGGKVLLAGGEDASSATRPTLTSADLFDPSTNMFTPTSNSLATSRELHTATVVSGKVYIIGGRSGSTVGYIFLGSVEVFDPTSGTFSTSTAALTTARTTHAATLLANGNKVLITGGFNFGALTSAEIFDPSGSGSFTVTGSMNTGRYSHTATLISPGNVLVTGGLNGATVLGNAEVYVPGP